MSQHVKIKFAYVLVILPYGGCGGGSGGLPWHSLGRGGRSGGGGSGGPRRQASKPWPNHGSGITTVSYCLDFF